MGLGKSIGGALALAGGALIGGSVADSAMDDEDARKILAGIYNEIYPGVNIGSKSVMGKLENMMKNDAEEFLKFQYEKSKTAYFNFL